jgi:hypothetical protein
MGCMTRVWSVCGQCLIRSGLMALLRLSTRSSLKSSASTISPHLPERPKSAPAMRARDTQYRIIHSAGRNYHVWAHLAMHATLARNVRQVFLPNKPSTACPDRCPTTLVAPLDFDEAAPDAEAKYMRALCRSLISMDLLTTFVWLTAPTLRYPFKDLRWEYLLFDILHRNHPHLRHLFLSGGFASSTHDIIHDPESTKYPVTISPLLSFSLLTNH